MLLKQNSQSSSFLFFIQSKFLVIIYQVNFTGIFIRQGRGYQILRRSQEKWYKSSVIDGQISQVSFRYPILGQKVYDLVPINMPNQQKNDSSPISVQQQQQQLQIFTSKKTPYKLARMKQQSSLGYNSSLDDSLEQLRIKSSSNVSQSSSSSPSNNTSSISNDNNVSLAIEEVRQIAQALSKQNEQNNAQMELIAKCLVQLVKQSTFISTNTIDNNHTRNIIPSSEQQIATSLSSSLSSSLSQAATVHSINTNQGREQQQEVEEPVITTKSNCNNRKVSERINQMIANEGIFEYPELRKALQREGYQDQSILATFVNNKHYIDTLIEIFKPRNVAASYQYVQQQQTQTSQQYQQNQQNQQQETQQYPSFIQQGEQFTVQDEQQQQQQVIEIEDEHEHGQKNISGNGNVNIKQLAQLNMVQQDDNEINKLSSLQMNTATNRDRSLSPLHHRQKDAQQKSIDNNKKGYEQKMQKQSYSLSNDPKSKRIRSKSPNSNNDNKSRSITPQKNLNLNQ